MTDEEALAAAIEAGRDAARHLGVNPCRNLVDRGAQAAVRAAWDLAVTHGREQAEVSLAATERTLDRMVSEAASDSIRLCVGTHHPIDPGNYPGAIHCLAHPQGHPCVTAMYGRTPDTTFTADERTIRRGTP